MKVELLSHVISKNGLKTIKSKVNALAKQEMKLKSYNLIIIIILLYPYDSFSCNKFRFIELPLNQDFYKLFL